MFAWFIENTAVTALLAAVVALVCRCLRQSPAVRHALWLIVLAKFVMPSLIAWPWGVQLGQNPPRGVPTPSQLAMGGLPVGNRPPALPSRNPPSAAATGDVAPAITIPQPSVGVTASTSPVAAPAPALIPDTAFPSPAYRVDWAAVLLRSAAGVWLAGAAGFLALQVWRIIRVWRLTKLSAPESLITLLHQVAAQLRLRPIPVQIANGLATPMIWSLPRPKLFWPAAPLGAAESTTRALILHELAHVKRRDHWIGWLELAAGTIWWWNPVFWFARQQLRDCAELACDQWVIQTLPSQRHAYAEALLTLCIAARPLPLAAVGMSARNRATLERRLTHILTGPGRARLSWGAALPLAAFFLLAIPAWSQQTTSAPVSAPARGTVVSAPPSALDAVAHGDHDALAKALAADPTQVRQRNADGQTVLALAADKADLAAVKLLVTAGAPINEGTLTGTTPLIFAAHASNLDVVKFLVEHGANVNASNKKELGPVLLALKGYYEHTHWVPAKMEIVDYLIAHGATLNVPEAAGANQLDRLAALLTQDPSLANKKDGVDHTPLMYAAMFDHPEAAALLLDHGADINAIEMEPSPMIDKMAKTALHYAVEQKALHAMALLLNRGADPNASQGSYYTPLQFAILNKDGGTAELLLTRGANVNAASGMSSEQTALQIAIGNKSDDLIDLLLAHKADPNAGGGLNSGSALFTALNMKNLPLLQKLVAAGARSNITDQYGKTLLHQAAAQEMPDAVALLLKSGDVNQRSFALWTPVHSAASAGSMKSLALLLASAKADLNAGDELGWTPLHWAVWHRHTDAMTALLDKGANPNLPAQDKLTPLALTMYRQDTVLADLLIARGATLDVVTAAGLGKLDALRALLAKDRGSANQRDPYLTNYQSGTSKSALHWAAITGHADCATALLDAGADIHAVDSNGMTALHEAVTFNHADVVRLLLARGADVSAPDHFLFTPLAIANEQEMPAVAELLRKAGAKDSHPARDLLARVNNRIAEIDPAELDAVSQANAAAVKARAAARATRPAVQVSPDVLTARGNAAAAELRKTQIFRIYVDDQTDEIWAYAFPPPCIVNRSARELLAPIGIPQTRNHILDSLIFNAQFDEQPEQNPANLWYGLERLALLDFMGDLQARALLTSHAADDNPLLRYYATVLQLQQVWWLAHRDPECQAGVIAALRQIAARLRIL